MNRLDSADRFSDRVDDYVRYRPHYPAALLEWLQSEHGVDAGWLVADIGAGTGISSKMFLDAGHRVIAVEPNAPMRAAAERRLGGNTRFRAIDGRAEATGLSDASVDLASMAQAFHWFDPAGTRRELQRILHPGGLVAIYWNSRRLAGTPFLEGYEALLQRYGTDYSSVAERYADDATITAWLGTGFRGAARFAHAQRLDFDGLRGRLLSSSYAPKAEQAQHVSMLQALHGLFERCAVDGTISFDYDTRIFVGTVD